jgi:hypothetical protein
VNGDRVAFVEGQVLLVRNNGSSARTITVWGPPARSGRPIRISRTLTASLYEAFGPFTQAEGWRHTDGHLYFTGNHADVEFAVLSPRKAATTLTPLSVAGLQGWYAGDRIDPTIATATDVTTLPDLSGNGRHASQSVAAEKPHKTLAIQNSLDVLRFDGTDDTLDADTFATAVASDTEGTVIVVATVDSLSVGGFFCAWGDTNALSYIYAKQDASGILMADQAQAATKWTLKFDAVNHAAQTFFIFAIRHDAIAPELFLNHKAYAQSFTVSTDKTYWMSKTTTLDNFRLMALNYNSGGDSNWGKGDVGEFMYFNRALTLAEFKRVHRYLSVKWNITLEA